MGAVPGGRAYSSDGSRHAGQWAALAINFNDGAHDPRTSAEWAVSFSLGRNLIQYCP